MALLAGELLDLELPRTDKRLLVIAETDGCTVDGISSHSRLLLRRQFALRPAVNLAPFRGIMLRKHVTTGKPCC